MTRKRKREDTEEEEEEEKEEEEEEGASRINLVLVNQCQDGGVLNMSQIRIRTRRSREI